MDLLLYTVQDGPECLSYFCLLISHIPARIYQTVNENINTVQKCVIKQYNYSS